MYHYTLCIEQTHTDVCKLTKFPSLAYDFCSVYCKRILLSLLSLFVPYSCIEHEAIRTSFNAVQIVVVMIYFYHCMLI